MRVHVFGNSPSPAVAIYGLRMAAREAESEYGTDAGNFIEQDFYVDNALKSFPTKAQAIDVLQRAQKMLALSNLHLHKIASSKVEVVNAFPPEDRVKDIKDLDLTGELPVQRSLGVSWNPTSDTVGAKRSISSVIHKCVTCRKLRGRSCQTCLLNAYRLIPHFLMLASMYLDRGRFQQRCSS